MSEVCLRIKVEKRHVFFCLFVVTGMVVFIAAKNIARYWLSVMQNEKNIWANIKVKQRGTWWMKDSSKYMLPTLRLLLKRWNYLKLKLHGLKLFIFINIKEKIVVDFSVGRRSNSTKTLFSPKFSITNKFRNNICLMKNGAVVVWVNFVDDRLHISISIELVLR
jgi:hypothetical protein